ncbi:MAG: hypothetical protein ACR2QC_06685 [Gammaproteobacteria bacterium]
MRFRRKPESPVPKARNFPPSPFFHSYPSSHSCEGRNLHAEGGNCTITRRYAAAEIPAFAGMGRREAAGISKLVSRNGFRLSPE